MVGRGHIQEPGDATGVQMRGWTGDPTDSASRDPSGVAVTRRTVLRGVGAGFGAGVLGSTGTATAEGGASQTGGDWPQFQFDLANTGGGDGLSGPTEGVEISWEATTWSSPVAADGTVYIGEGDGLVAYALADGTEQWRQDFGTVRHAPAVVDGVVYAGVEDVGVVAADAASGAEQWRAGASVGVPVVAVDGTVLAMGGTEIVALDAADGSEQWRTQVRNANRNDVRATPAVANGTAYVPTGTGTVEARSLADGSLEWEVSMSSTVSAHTIALGDRVIAETGDGLRALAQGDGTELWLHEPGLDFEAGFALGDGRLVTGSEQGSIHAIDPADGSEVWTVETGADDIPAPPVVAGDLVYVVDGGGTLRALSLADGSEQWQFVSGDCNGLAVADGVLLAGDTPLLALQPTGGDEPANEPPTAEFTYEPQNPTPVPGQELSFEDRSRDPNDRVVGREWAFGDGTTATGRDPTHTYETDGEYEVTLSVRDRYGATDTATETVLVAGENERPRPAFTVSPANPAPGEEVTLNGGDSSDPDGEVVAHDWDVDGDQSFEAAGETVTASFEASTVVTLRVTDSDGATATRQRTVEVVDDSGSGSAGDGGDGTGTTTDGGTGVDDGGALQSVVSRELPAPAVVGGAAVGGGALLGGGALALRRLRDGSATTADGGPATEGDGTGSTADADAGGRPGGGDTTPGGSAGSGESPGRSATGPAVGGSAPAVGGGPASGPDVEGYETLGRIGSGGTADVFRARNPDGEVVALKTPRVPDLQTVDTDVFERFLREAEVWSQLDDHPNVVSVHDWGSQPVPWIALEFCDDGTLGERCGELAPTTAAETMAAVCEATHHAHRHGVSHADLKPSNVLFRDGTPKVTDWGLAQVLLEHSQSVDGMTPAYAAPEQIRDEGGVDDRTDIYQLGVLSYELLTGRRPFEGDSYAGTVQAVLGGEYDPPSAVVPSLPAAVDDVIATALASDPADRQETALHLRDALVDALEGPR